MPTDRSGTMNYFKYACITEFGVKAIINYTGNKKYKLKLTFSDYSFNHKLWSWKKFHFKIRRKVHQALLMQIATVVSQFINTAETSEERLLLFGGEESLAAAKTGVDTSLWIKRALRLAKRSEKKSGEGSGSTVDKSGTASAKIRKTKRFTRFLWRRQSR